MKKTILLLLIPVIIAGCSNNTPDTNNSNAPVESTPVIEENRAEEKIIETAEPATNTETVEPHDDTGLPPHRH